MALGSARDMISRELQDAVACLHEDIARVEFWADALCNFAKPIPDYEPSGSRLNQFITDSGHAPGGVTPEEFRKFLVRYLKDTAEQLRLAGVKPE